MRQPRLAKMHLRIDDTRQDVQPLAVHHLGRIARDRAKRNNLPALDRNIGQSLAIMIDHGRVLENRVVLRPVSYPADG